MFEATGQEQGKHRTGEQWELRWGRDIGRSCCGCIEEKYLGMDGKVGDVHKPRGASWGSSVWDP